jgi:plastocyanin
MAALAALMLTGELRLAEAQELFDVTARLGVPETSVKGATRKSQDHPPAAIWLVPLDGQPAPADPVHKYTLLQKNKEFSPHLLVVPVGSVVQFPNADPFFHNVFSLFDGRRFDLGLYEAGSTREVTFGKEGISYIFCNIHPEMSAVVIALTTPYFAVAEPHGVFKIPGVAPGNYRVEVWVQGIEADELKALSHKVNIAAGHTDVGVIPLPNSPHAPAPHTNKYGKPYDSKESTAY